MAFIFINFFLIFEVSFPGGLKDDTSTLCCLPSSRLCELVDVPPTGKVWWLSTPSFLWLLVVSSKNSSSERGFSLSLLAPSCYESPLAGVATSLSLFLFISSFRGFCKIGGSPTLPWVEGVCIWACSLEISGYLDIVNCSVIWVLASGSFPLDFSVASVLVSCECYWEVPAIEALIPNFWEDSSRTYRKESRSSVFSRSLIIFSILTCSLSVSTKVPSLHSSILANFSISGILWCMYGDSLCFILLSQIKLWESYGIYPKLLCNLRWSSRIFTASLHASLVLQTKGPN